MNKAELVTKVVEKLASREGEDKIKVTKGMMNKYVDAVFDTISDAMVIGDEVKITGFGVFSAPVREAHEGRNPRTGESVQIPAIKHPRFTAYKSLKDLVKDVL